MKTRKLIPVILEGKGVLGRALLMLLAGGVGFFLTQAKAQTAAYASLEGHVPKVCSTLQPTGVLSATNVMKLAIGLSFRNAQALGNLHQHLYDPSGPNYRRFLTPEQFTDQFGPTLGDYQAVIDFVQANGLTVTKTWPNRLVLDVEGPVSKVESAFSVKMQTYQHPIEARTFYAPSIEPSVPSALPILGISGLDTYTPPRPVGLVQSAVPGAVPAAGSGQSGYYIGKDYRAAYVPGVSLTGSGQIVGVVAFDGYYASDIASYETRAGQSAVNLENVLLDGADGSVHSFLDDQEVSLDIENVIAMAPGLFQVTVYEGYSGYDILNEIAVPTHGELLPKQVTCSWCWNGGSKSVIDQILQEMAAQGQSFFTCSGDGDVWCDGIFIPLDDPFATVVGGTELSMTGSGGTYSSETVWDFGYDPPGWNITGNGYVGSGGGISTSFLIPDWQLPVSMSVNGGSTTYRNIPDVAIVADNVEIVAWNGSVYSVSGTSCGAPLWAGFTALVNQKALSENNTTVGFLNPSLYAIDRGASYSSAFHDILTGNNANGTCNGFSACTGYDLCTGWGTPAGNALITALAASPNLVNIQFTSAGGPQQVGQGPAATGYSGSDYWNKIYGGSESMGINGFTNTGLLDYAGNPTSMAILGNSQAGGGDPLNTILLGSSYSSYPLFEGAAWTLDGSPYTFELDGVRAGRYTIIAYAEDPDGPKSTTFTLSLVDGSGGGSQSVGDCRNGAYASFAVTQTGDGTPIYIEASTPSPSAFCCGLQIAVRQK